MASLDNKTELKLQCKNTELCIILKVFLLVGSSHKLQIMNYLLIFGWTHTEFALYYVQIKIPLSSLELTVQYREEFLSKILIKYISHEKCYNQTCF